MFKKGQVALEFLMTYGWAILVVLVAIGALAYFGVLDPGKFLPSRCTLPAGFSCNDFLVNGADDIITVALRNGLGYDITDVNIQIGDCLAAADTTLQNGQEKQLVTLACTTPLSPGAKFSDAIRLSYTNADSGIAHIINGTITGRVQ